MTMHHGVLLFLVAWYAMLIYSALDLWSDLFAMRTWQSQALWPAGIMVAMWGVCIGSFTYEAGLARRLLVQVLERNDSRAAT